MCVHRVDKDDNFLLLCLPGLWIQIRMDPISFSLPDPGGKKVNKKQTKRGRSQYRSAHRLFCGLDLKCSSFQTRRHDVSDSWIAAREGSAASQECVRFESRAALRDSDCERRNRAWRSNQTFFAGLASASLSFARWASISSVSQMLS